MIFPSERPRRRESGASERELSMGEALRLPPLLVRPPTSLLPLWTLEKSSSSLMPSSLAVARKNVARSLD